MEEHRTLGVAERSLAFMRGLNKLETLDAVVNLVCTLLGNPVFLCDARGTILAISPGELSGCAAWADMARTRRVTQQRLREARQDEGARPRVRQGGAPDGPPCPYMALPVRMDEINPPGALCVFAWLDEFDERDVQLAGLIAGMLEVLLKKKFGVTCMPQTAKIQLLRELLNYKPGMHSSFVRSIAIENMHQMPGLFRVVHIELGEEKKKSGDHLAGVIRRYVDGVWIFSREDHLVAVLNEGLVSPEDYQGALERYLRENGLSGCISTGFRRIIDLRHVYEITRSAWLVGSRRAPGEALYRAQEYQLFAFLSKCQKYFPIEECCPDGLLRLAECDEQSGRGYIGTLSAYLDHHLNANATARALFMHRSTLAQRLEKIEQVLGLSLEDKEVQLYLQLCLRIQALLQL